VANPSTSSSASLAYPLPLPARIRALASDRTTIALIAVFLLGASFYLWRATLNAPLALHGGANTPYNLLAEAFLHLRLWVVKVPATALGAGNPYNPAQRSAFLFGYRDYSLYGNHLYISWGPAPVLVLLVPLHLLGFEPSASVIMVPFTIVGLGFALAALRVILTRIGDVSLWMCIIAAFTLTCASVIPYVLRFPLVYHEEIVGGYCFAMAGIWLGVSAVVDGRASLKRLALMSLCIGLATGSRVTLGVMGLLLVAVYLSLRSTRQRRSLLTALAAPFGVCVLLLAAYNQARFGSVLENGAKLQINRLSTYTAHFGELGYLAPGLWSYLIAPPRIVALFPFVLINYPQVSYPFSLPAHYQPLSEETGGLLAMAPIAIFLVALPWIWRRRPAALGSLAPLLLAMAIAGVACMAFVAFEIYISTERYEADYMTLLLFGALAAWLVLSSATRGPRRRLVRTVGALLAVWSCATGMAISCQEFGKHIGTWRTLANLGAPLSRAIATIAGHPVIGDIDATHTFGSVPSYSNLGTGVNGFSLAAGEQVEITIVSPNSREDALITDAVAPVPRIGGAEAEIRVAGPEKTSAIYRLAGGSRLVWIPIHLNPGVNQLVLSPVRAQNRSSTREPAAEWQAPISFSEFTLAGG
jgi:hypothetical protein